MEAQDIMAKMTPNAKEIGATKRELVPERIFEAQPLNPYDYP